jgi:tetratricopeptide (TPR) repeat protein
VNVQGKSGERTKLTDDIIAEMKYDEEMRHGGEGGGEAHLVTEVPASASPAESPDTQKPPKQRARPKVETPVAEKMPSDEELGLSDTHLTKVRGFREEAKSNPDDPSPHIGIARVCVIALDVLGSDSPPDNKRKVAVHELETALKMPPDKLDIDTFSDIGRLYERLELYDDAIGVYRLAVSRYPKSSQPHKWLANTYLYQSDYDKALEEYAEANRKEPGNPRTLIDIGSCYLRRNNPGDIINALKSYMDARKIVNEREGQEQELYPLHLAIAGGFDEIAGLSEKRLQEESGQDGSMSALRQELQNFAIEQLEKASKLAGKIYFRHGDIAYMHKRAGRFELAIKEYEKARELGITESSIADDLKECEEKLKAQRGAK